MVDLIRRHVPLSRGVGGDRRRTVRDKAQHLSPPSGPQPRDRELAEALGVTVGRTGRICASASEPLRFEAIDEAYSDSDGLCR